MIEDSVPGFNVIRTDTDYLVSCRGEVGSWYLGCLGNGLFVLSRRIQVPGGGFMLRLRYGGPRQNEPACYRLSNGASSFLRDRRRSSACLPNIGSGGSRRWRFVYYICSLWMGLLAEQEAYSKGEPECTASLNRKQKIVGGVLQHLLP
jgi:hypothetical protein